MRYPSQVLWNLWCAVSSFFSCATVSRHNGNYSCHTITINENTNNIPVTLIISHQSFKLHCVPKKTCDHIFDDKLKQNYPFTKIFGTLITKSIGHRQVYLASHLTYFVHLLYLGKLSRPKYHEFS